MEDGKKFPELKKRVKMFLQSEEGKITKEQALAASTTLILMTIAFVSAGEKAGERKVTGRRALHEARLKGRVTGLHGSHSSHGSHCSHGSHASHGSHGSHSSHGSHGSHSSHGSHGSHSSHASHGSW